MLDRQHWDWDTGEKKIPFSDWKKSYNWVEEPQTSPDGEKIAAIVNIDEGEFTVCVNGQSWEPVYDKIWYLRFSPDGRATALVSEMGEWTVAVDGVPWENRYGYVWNTCFSPDGKRIAVAVVQDMKYGMAINDVSWETTYANMTDPVLSPDGNRSAAAVQVANFGAAEIEFHKLLNVLGSMVRDGIVEQELLCFLVVLPWIQGVRLQPRYGGWREDVPFDLVRLEDIPPNRRHLTVFALSGQPVSLLSPLVHR